MNRLTLTLIGFVTIVIPVTLGLFLYSVQAEYVPEPGGGNVCVPTVQAGVAMVDTSEGQGLARVDLPAPACEIPVVVLTSVAEGQALFRVTALQVNVWDPAFFVIAAQAEADQVIVHWQALPPTK